MTNKTSIKHKSCYIPPVVCTTDCVLERMMALSKYEEEGDEEQLVKTEFSLQDNVWADAPFGTEED